MNGHISDDRLIEICLPPPTAATGRTDDEQTHLVACTRCELRRVEIVGILSELDDAATQEAGEAFPEAKLERQQARILQRVEQDGRPGRVVTFPMQRPATTFLTPSRPRMRWAAGVAAAAFVAGLLTGQWTHTFTDTNDTTLMHVVANDSEDVTVRPVSTTFSDEEFLGQIEVAASRNGPVALRTLDAMTPRAWEVR